ncbi:MAG: glycoside hydrolase family 3 N-terminal domain-containing protein [Microgenomates group bacterium]
MSQRWSLRILIFILLILTVVAGYNYFVQPFNQVFEEAPIPTPSPTVVEKPAQELFFDQLTPRQRVAQMIAAPLTLDAVEIATPSGIFDRSLGDRTSAQDAEMTALFLEESYGFVTIFGEGLAGDRTQSFISSLSNQDQPLNSPIVMVDHEGGSVQRLRGEGFEELPSWKTLCEEERSDRLRILQTSARQLSRVGIDIVLAPVVDIADDHPILQDRICSGDPLSVLTAGIDFVDAFSKQGVMPVLKHFPGIGDTTQDLHTDFDKITVSDDSVYLYKYLLGQYPNIGVMISHVGVVNQYPDTPCSLSIDCVSELRKEYPAVLVLSDALEMSSARLVDDSPDEAPLADVAVKAATAGVEVLLFGEGVSSEELNEIATALEIQYNNNAIFRDHVDKSAKKIIELKHNMQATE